MEKEDIRKPTLPIEEVKKRWRKANAQYALGELQFANYALVDLLKMFVELHPCPRVVFDEFEKKEESVIFLEEIKLLKIIFEDELKEKIDNDNTKDRK